jgi:hypothetical protein
MRSISKLILPALLLNSICAVTIHAQTGCTVPYGKGQKFHYVREDAPNILTAIPDYWKYKGKEKKAVDEQFKLDVASGKVKGKEYAFDMNIGDEQKGNNGYVHTFEYVTPAATYKSYVSCRQDTIYGIRSLTGYPMVGSAKDTVGFFKPGIVTYPKNMKVGDLLPVTTDLAYTFPQKMDLSYKRTVLDRVQTISSSQCSQGYCNVRTSTTSYFKEVTKNLNYNLQFSAPTLTYRHVVGEEEVTVGGKKYKAYKIEMLLETKLKDVISDVEADEKIMKYTLEFLNGYIKNKANKSPELKQHGNEWFVPELGTVVLSEIYDKDGNIQYKSILKSID